MDLMYGTSSCMEVEGYHRSVCEYFYDSELSQKYQFTSEDGTYEVTVLPFCYLSHNLHSS
jgi:hypothetical protein